MIDHILGVGVIANILLKSVVAKYYISG